MQDFFAELPDRRIELIDDQFIVGASLEGSRRLLKILLETWGGNAALSLTPTVTPWVKALNLAYGFSYPTEEKISEAELKSNLSAPAKIELKPMMGNDSRSLALASELNMVLFPEKVLKTFGRDFANKLGEDALSPNGMIIHNQSQTLYHYYLDGTSDIAYEFIREENPLTRQYDIYLQNGLSELWEFNIVTGQVRTFSFGFHKYINEFSGDCGIISSTSIPELNIEVVQGWNQWSYRNHKIETFRLVSAPNNQLQHKNREKNGIGWDSFAFAPIIDLEPFPITFNEFISWTGETKFEFYDGRLSVGTPDGTRNIFGELLMTFGLVEAVKLMPPIFWMNAINERFHQLNQQETIKQTMWENARQAAQILRDKFNFTEIAVAGDLVNDSPPGLWSKTTLVFPELKRRPDYFEIYEALCDENGKQVETYYSNDYIPLEIKNTFDQMIFI